jgi:hypothetical protein
MKLSIRIHPDAFKLNISESYDFQRESLRLPVLTSFIVTRTEDQTFRLFQQDLDIYLIIL